jgi:hypothetical protein
MNGNYGDNSYNSNYNAGYNANYNNADANAMSNTAGMTMNNGMGYGADMGMGMGGMGMNMGMGMGMGMGMNGMHSAMGMGMYGGHQKTPPPGYVCRRCQQPGEHLLRDMVTRNTIYCKSQAFREIKIEILKRLYCLKTGHFIQDCPTNNQGPKVPPPGYICKRCQQPGHFVQDCPTNQCFKCGGTGGLSERVYIVTDQIDKVLVYLRIGHIATNCPNAASGMSGGSGGNVGGVRVPPANYLCKKCQQPGMTQQSPIVIILFHLTRKCVL